jgi:hypothetical protein
LADGGDGRWRVSEQVTRRSASRERGEQQGHHGEVEESEGELGHGKAAVVEGFDLG